MNFACRILNADFSSRATKPVELCLEGCQIWLFPTRRYLFCSIL